MKKIVLTSIATFAIIVSMAQPWPRQERFILDNNKQMTDMSVSLFNVHSDYDFPYVIPSRENVTEKLTRILRFLEMTTPKAIVDPKTGETVTDFNHIPDPFVFEKGDFRPYNYEWGVTYSGMLKAAEVTGESAFKDYVVKRMKLLSQIAPEVKRKMNADKQYKSPINRVVDPTNLDQCGALCAAMIRTMYLNEPGIDLRPIIDNSADWISNKQYRLPDKTLARKQPYESTLWLDDLYMSVPALSELYRLTGDTRYVDDAARQILQFSQRMFDPESGLYRHAWVDVMKKHPRWSWGRANGWATLSMCDLLDVMPADHPQRQAILDQFEAHCWALLQYQSGKGMWYQLVDREDSYLESSGTAMFVYGLAHGINKGWLDAKIYGPAALTGWNALSEQINNTGQIENVCVGTGVSFEPTYYYYRHVHHYTAHGYGPVLLAGSEIISLVENFHIVQKTSIYFQERK